MPKTIDQIARQTAQKYGLPYEYVRGLIQYESKGDPTARSPTGARGLTQFTKGTGAAYGLNRRNINDPEANVDAAGRLARDNYNAFQRRMGRPPTPDELYLAHLQGAGGATSGLKRPDEPAISVFGTKAVKSNLPRSMRSNLNTITAKEFQDIHRGNINKEMGKYKEISDSPTLDQLSPSKPKANPVKTETIPLSQLAPTEASPTMARSRYDNEINSALDAVSQGGRRGYIQLAGAIPTPRTPRSKVPNADKQMGGTYQDYVKKEKERMAKEKPKAEEGPYNRKSEGTRGMEGTYEDYVRRQKAGSTEDLRPKPVKTERIGPGAYPAAAVPAAGVGAAAAAGGAGGVAAQNDPAIQERIARQMRGGRGAADPAVEAVRRSIERSGPGASVQSEASPPAAGNILSQAAPIIKEALKDPPVQQAAKVVAGGMAKAAARIHGAQADMQSDPTYYQMMASQGQMPGGVQDDRAMERAVMMDNARRSPVMGRQQVPRGIQTAPASLPPQPPPQASMPPPQQMAGRIPMEQDASYGMTHPTINGALPSGALDPTMMQLMQFFSGGGGVG